MNLREMELFGTLMRVGTTTETARLLGISQPGVSAQLKRLEANLGISLFHRTGNRLEPTREANEIFALSAPIFSTHAQIRARLPTLRSQASRPVAISATPALVEGFLGPILIRAGYQNWKKRLILRVNSPEEDLRKGTADIGLQMAFPPKAEFQAHTIGQSTLVAVLRTDHPLAREDDLFCDTIAAHPMVCYNADWSPMGATIRAAFEAQGLVYDPACVVPFCANVCDMVRACGGVGIVDAMTAREYAMQGLVSRRIVDMPPVAILAFHRRNEPLSAPVQDFLSQLISAA
ncbi:LysR family transcriptional regulator [Paenirhodobacter populi]|uniref:LysR family transcriptional regulator n=1 Tax=Paenirhodobacter populi TaxID=2306993 RepID=A0A443K8Q7_9RHOB|nr:LysR family transcriptional regulator [Sinirhodobacter populi]RWR07153.1 LysR family transcriptional regulator [Sinirhodobacter populi]RWR29154.1 LysR family transcriptional regulator [Sinirhodobacter populi]RWR34567.1 LysR family transcriptional regulator [Sinirhodobacter populi]